MKAAALVSAERARAIGLDAEPWEPLPDGILELIASPEKQIGFGEGFLTGVGGRLLFSAKEAAFKAMHALGTTVMEPHALFLSLDMASIVSMNEANESAHGTFTVNRVDTDLWDRGRWA